MRKEYFPLGEFSYTKHRCFIYNQVTFEKVNLEILGVVVPLTVRLCLN